MGVDWAQALSIGARGFGTVFVVLIILAVAVLLVGLAIRRSEAKKNKTESATKEGN